MIFIQNNVSFKLILNKETMFFKLGKHSVCFYFYLFVLIIFFDNVVSTLILLYVLIVMILVRNGPQGRVVFTLVETFGDP